MRGTLLAALVAATVTACSFQPGATSSSDAGTDGPPPIVVGFATGTTLADEASGTVPVRVVLSAASADAISVTYAISGGTATTGDDYTGGSGTLNFAPGDVEETLDLVINADGSEEPDETISLELQAISGPGAILATAAHTVTISANLLPRVTFTAATSQANENVNATIDVMLTAASPLTTSVDITLAGTANDPADYAASTTTVTFGPNETQATVTLTVVNDSLDEDDETVTLDLANPTNVIVGATPMRTHTIVDNDNAPDARFAAGASSIREDGVSTDITVSLTAASGRSVSVPFTVTGTANDPADYNVATASPLTFAAGETQKTITVEIEQDTALEMPETVVLTLGTPTNAGLGTPSVHTLTIMDDDQTCLGSGAYVACYPTPAADVTMAAGVVDTDTDVRCQANQPTPWTGQPASCFIVGRNVTVAGALVVTGSRPLVLFASEDLRVSAPIDASSHRGLTPGPGASGQTCTFVRNPTNDTSGAGGGAGGTFRTKGGDGGDGNGAADTSGLAAAVGDAPTTLRAGCAGQTGGRGNSPPGSNGGLGGLGGGALYFVAGDTLTIDNGIFVYANGAGATAQTTPNSGFFAGGGGGGSGGMIKLHAAALSVSGARLMATGGGGSSGADNNTAGVSGSDPLGTNVNNVGAGGVNSNAGGDGGDGGAAAAAEIGGDGVSNEGGGGGGGGGGYIESNLALTGAQAGAGQVVVP